MSKKDCPAGRKWDTLLNVCIYREPEPEPEPQTELHLMVAVQRGATSPTAPSDPVTVLSPTLWIFVVFATLGSSLALVLWLIIYRQQTRSSSTSEDTEPGLEPLQKTPTKTHSPLPERNSSDEMMQKAASAPPPCPHLHPEAQTGSDREDGSSNCRGPANHAGAEEGGGPVRAHRVPLPATELGGTALVTTKTV
ncbi:uncharacterized protein ACBR49_013359 [Aulostomus maculatus]